MALSSSAALEGGRTVVEYRATGATPQRPTEKLTQALERIGSRQGLVRELAMIAGVSDAVIRGLIKAGALEAAEVSVDTPFRPPDPDFAQPELNDAQEEAEEHTSELQSLMRTSYAVFCLQKKKQEC